jgi:hypothetical protein
MEVLIEQAARELWKPAGDSEMFSSPESMLRHHSEFVLRCHATWKKWHEEAVHQLLFHEGFLRREKTHPLGRGAKEFGEYNRAVWRRVNDTIVWSLFGAERHRVKRLCLYRKRGDLSESNPDSAMAAVATINAQPMSFALWNDATSCVDIGDLTVIENGMNPVPKFIELKEGTVNEAIHALLLTQKAPRVAAIKAFKEQYGKKGAQQLDRVLRQQRTGDQALNLLINEKGTDPLSGHEIRVIETPVKPQTYDEALAAVLQTSLTDRRAVTECVDGCLWIFVNADKRLEKDTTERFVELLGELIPKFSLSDGVRHPQSDRDKIRYLSSGVHYPIARPLFLRKLPSSQIASVTCGTLRRNVLLYLDWNAFGRLIQRAGGDFRWGSKRDAGRSRSINRHLRPPLIGGRLPQIHVDGAIGYITDPNLVEIFYDGVTPWSMAQITVQELRRMVIENGHPG